jgi:sulfur relay (sulfurtransferase) DsrC/TusE family protein
MAYTYLKKPEIAQMEIPLHFDEDAFLINTTVWNSGPARIFAEVDGIGRLSPNRWVVISFLHEKYSKYGGLPLLSRVCRNLKLGRSGVHVLFGCCLAAWRVAGFLVRVRRQRAT